MESRKVYVDASVVLRTILKQPGAIADYETWDLAVTSELMQLEALRTFDRLFVTGRWSPSELADYVDDLRTFTDGFQRVPIGPAVLRRASGPIPSPLGALDAIHLATALLWMESNLEDLTLVTHDRQLAAAARAYGMEVRI